MIIKSMELAGGVKPPECLSSAYVLATLSLLPFSPSILSAINEKYELREIANLENM